MSASPARSGYPGQVARALQGKIFFPPDPGFDEVRPTRSQSSENAACPLRSWAGKGERG
jgi:hypothetical protein